MTKHIATPYHRIKEIYGITMTMFLLQNFRNTRRYATIEKAVGETPLVAAERLRAAYHIPATAPLAYAGRLDPMASGKLLILIGDECKVQEKYHSLDKEYIVELLLGVSSDTGDVLGLLSTCQQQLTTVATVKKVLSSLIGTIELPYPHFSSKTVRGKPLHTWTLENRLDEIEIPIKKSTIHQLSFQNLREVTKDEILKTVRKKIETIPPVTEEKKALGADFRRDDVRKDWSMFEKNDMHSFQIVTFRCIASSGTYMRSLCSEIANSLGSCGLAYSIHRTKIGRFHNITRKYGLWLKQF